jgi:prevent-host-death family protein
LDVPTINIHQAKTQLSHLLQRVAAGEEITIANRGVPVARLVPLEHTGGRRRLGIEHDRVWISDNFDEPLPPKLLAGFLAGRKGKKNRSGR